MQLTSDKQSPNSFPQVHLFFFFLNPNRRMLSFLINFVLLMCFKKYFVFPFTPVTVAVLIFVC